MSVSKRIAAAGIGCGLALVLSLVSAEPVLRSPRNASYSIDVTLDARQRSLEGSQVLAWRNIRARPARELRFHLYWNGWRNNRSTWMIEDRIRGRSEHKDGVEEDDWGWIDVRSIRLRGAAGEPPVELMPEARFAAPDDGNADDRTVLVVSLPRDVESGETIEVELDWSARVPRTFARTGFRGDFYLLAHWFPKLGVWEDAGWNCHQFHAATEFFSDYGVYDVRMTVPEEFVVGATGRELDRRDNGDGTATHHYRQEDVHAFTWTASPLYQVAERRFDEPGLPPVDMRLLYQPEHRSQVDRHLDATAAALGSFGRWYGPYPYDHVTLIDPAYGSGAGGMEYPTLFTCGTRLFNPFGGDNPESVTIHEMGHQFWYGAVGNNEFEHAWIDEGLNTFSTIRTLETNYDDRILVRRYLLPPWEEDRRRGFIAVRFPDIRLDRWGDRMARYRRDATTDTPSTPTYLYYPKTAGSITYSKTALWMATLERHLGWETLREILATFYERHRFGHPTPQDFLTIASEVVGSDMSWFFDQVHHGSDRFDYAVSMAESIPTDVEGWIEGEEGLTYVEAPEDEDEGDDDDRIHRTQVVVRRLGGGRFPVDVRLVFEDGHEMRESWDGQDRWHSIVVERPGKLDYAEVDPDRVLLLDTWRTNNSRERERESRFPATKWGSKWMIWLQDLLATLAFFA